MDNKEKIEKLAKKLSVASDQNRMKILCVIFDRKKICVSEIAEMLGLSVAIVSHHLQCLAAEGLIEPQKEGKMTCYQVREDGFIDDLRRLICKYK